MTIQLPPLSSSRTGPPQKLVRQARERAHYPETATYDPRKEDTVRSVTSDQLVRRLPTVAYPQKSDSNLSQGPVIYRPHPHQKHTGLLEFRAPSHPLERGDDRDARPPPGPECTAARSARGRRPFKHETVRTTTLVEGNHVGSCRGFWGGRSGHKRVVSSTPSRSAQSARTRAGSTARGRETGVPSPPKECSGASSNEEVLSASAPAPPPQPSRGTGLLDLRGQGGGGARSRPISRFPIVSRREPDHSPGSSNHDHRDACGPARTPSVA